MRFRVERDVLAEAVAWAARSLPARPPVPVLAGLMLSADTDAAGRLVLSSFDYEVSADSIRPASTGTGGRAGKLRAAQATASASTSRSTRNLTGHRLRSVHPQHRAP